MLPNVSHPKNEPGTNPSPPARPEKVVALPLPLTLADMILAMIETKRREINQMAFGEISINIQHYIATNLELTTRYARSEFVKPPDAKTP